MATFTLNGDGATAKAEPGTPSGGLATRREFIQGAGITMSLGTAGIIGACEMSPGDTGAPGPVMATNDAVTPNAWVNIGADGTITIQFGATEMGQGSMTSVPLVLAEEMDADWEQVRVETVSRHDPTYGNPVAFGYYGFPIMYTAGSAALRGYFNAMRQAGAQARKFLLDAAAEQLGVPVEELSTEKQAPLRCTGTGWPSTRASSSRPATPKRRWKATSSTASAAP